MFLNFAPFSFPFSFHFSFPFSVTDRPELERICHSSHTCGLSIHRCLSG